MIIAAIVLAAGRGSRFADVLPGGPPKMLAPIDGVPMIRRTVESLVAGGVDRSVVVVSGSQATTIARALSGLTVTCVVNPDPDLGMFSSIQCGFVAAAGAGICVMLPGDMPFVQPATVARLLAAAAASGRTAVPRLDDRPGHPVVCGPGLRDRILAAGPAARLDHLIQEEDVLHVDVTDTGVRRDVDRPADLSGSI
jgi:molybdenum cofactor cytidylyltransferase